MTFPGWHEATDEEGSERDVKPFPSMIVLKALGVVLVFAVLLCFVAIIWQHVATVAAMTTMQVTPYGTVRCEVGTLVMVLGWIAVAMLAICSIKFAALYSSMLLLDRLTEN